MHLNRLLAVLALVLALVAPQALASPLTGAAPSSSPTSANQTVAGQSEPESEPDPVAKAILQARVWVLTEQRRLQRQLAERLRGLREAPSATTASALILISFLYGVLHATGPGHGKFVISAYLLTHRQRAIQGVLIASLASLMQGLTAIVLVFSLVKLGGWLARDAIGQTATVEMLSFALVSLLGAWLILRGLRQLWARRATGAAGCSAAAIQPGRGTLLAVVAAVGIRPCTGAVTVLAVANLLNLWLAGLVAVLAMSIGTAITVSVLAGVAVHASRLIERAAVRPHPLWRHAGPVAAILGGVAILSLGLLLLQGSASAPAHPLLF